MHIRAEVRNKCHCPKCGAEQYQPCKYGKRRTGKNHKERCQLATRVDRMEKSKTTWLSDIIDQYDV